MADFHQNGSVATLHNLSLVSLQEIERQLEAFTSGRKITLILPSLFSELAGPALANIVDVLTKVKYINHIIIGLDQASEAEFAFARNYFSKLPQKHDILWNDGPRLREIDSELSNAKLAPSEAGKGRNVWYCMVSVAYTPLTMPTKWTL